MSFIKTRDELRNLVVDCVKCKCEVNELPYSMRNLSHKFFANYWHRFGVTPRELCLELQSDGLLTVYDAVPGEALLLSKEYVELIKSEHVGVNKSSAEQLIEYDEALKRLATQSLTRPSRLAPAEPWRLE